MTESFETIIQAIPIKPYYRDEQVDIVIYNADCREILPLIPDKSIDLVLTDPPYGINFNGDWMSEMNLAHGKPANKSDALIIGDDGSINLDFLFNFEKRVIFGHPYIYDKSATGWLVWDKQPGLDSDRTMGSPVEMASTTCWKGFRMVRCMWAGYMRDNGEYRFEHPTQKPQKVINYCINKASEPNEIILDPFLGSGTTLVCAKKLGRKAIGIEISEKYCEISKNRLRQSVMKLEVSL